jgi:hypothetical protein
VQDLGQVTGALDEIAIAAAERSSLVVLLAHLTATLRDGSALVNLRVDTTGGTLVALAPQATTLAAELKQLDALASVEIVGAITREKFLDTEVERITLRFQLSPFKSVSR